MVPKNHGRRSHSGIPGSTAAYAYPGLFRGWPRPSSALKPSHPPDGVACRAFCGSVCLTLVNLLPMHGDIYELKLIFTLHSSFFEWELHLNLCL